MSKRVALSVAKPRIEANVEGWIKDRHGHEGQGTSAAVPEAPAAAPEPTVRLTFDVPKSLHKRLKQGALDRDVAIADVLREMIAREFPAP